MVKVKRIYVSSNFAKALKKIAVDQDKDLIKYTEEISDAWQEDKKKKTKYNFKF